MGNRHQRTQVALLVEAGRHEIADDAFVDSGGIIDLSEGRPPRFADVVLEAGPGLAGVELGTPRAEAHSVGASGEIEGFGHALHGRLPQSR